MADPLNIYAGTFRFTPRLYSYSRFAFAPQTPRYVTTMRASVPEAPDIMLNGGGMIAGQLTEQGVPSGERVIALEARSLRAIVTANADPQTGEFRLYPLVSGRRYLVMAVDKHSRFNAVVMDGVLPVEWRDEL